MDLANKAEGGEVEHSVTNVPRAILLALIINGILAFGWIIALLFSIGNIKAALESPTEYPIIEILYQATGSIGSANGMYDVCYHHRCFFDIHWHLASTSRLTFAFAHDKGLPFFELFACLMQTLPPYKALLAKASLLTRIARSQFKQLTMWVSSSVQ